MFLLLFLSLSMLMVEASRNNTQITATIALITYKYLCVYQNTRTKGEKFSLAVI